MFQIVLQVSKLYNINKDRTVSIMRDINFLYTGISCIVHVLLSIKIIIDVLEVILVDTSFEEDEENIYKVYFWSFTSRNCATDKFYINILF